MHEEFEQLLEANWEGRLDASGRRRLEELCAADPALARRLDEERRMSRLLAAVGPHRSPSRLAAGVFARLEGEKTAEGTVAAAGAARPVRTPTPRWSWWSIPVLRWGMGLAVVALIGVEVGVLVEQNRGKPVLEARNREIAASRERQVALLPEGRVVPGQAGRREAARLKATQAASRADALRPAEESAGEPNAPQQATESAAAPTAGRAVPVPTPEPTPSPQAAQETVVAQATPAAKVVAIPAAELQRAAPATPAETTPAAPVSTPGERRVAMQIVLPAALGAVGGASPIPSTAIRSRRPALPKQGGLNAFQGESAGAAVGGGSTGAPTRRDIETAVAMAGGRIEETRPSPDQPELWQVHCRLTPDQLQTFLRSLRELGLQPAESQERAQAVEAARAPVAQPPAKPGKSLDRFERLKTMGIEVERGGAPETFQPSRPTSIPTASLPPGRYAVLEGEPLLKALEPARPGGASPSVRRTSGVKDEEVSIELLLLIQQP